MNLPPELQPTATIDIRLPSGNLARLPVCRPDFARWSGVSLGFDFGAKPVLNHEGQACFAELVILRLLLANGWNGAWIETFGGIHFWRSMPKRWSLESEHVSIPIDKEAILKRIWKMAATTACFDVFAWQGLDLLFGEAKRAKKDRLTVAQVRFIEGALVCGIAAESLLIVEWAEMPSG